MTGRALEEDKKAAMKSGCDQFLVKPIKHEIIQEIVKKIVSGKTTT